MGGETVRTRGVVRGLLAVGLAGGLLLGASGPRDRAHTGGGDLLRTSDACLACHNGLVAAAGEDVSIGSDWRASMMANSARDPYWQAAVRREVMDHLSACAAIEDECATCHMPTARYLERLDGRPGEVFTNLPVGASRAPHAGLAADGVSCSMCHRIGEEGLGEGPPASPADSGSTPRWARAVGSRCTGPSRWTRAAAA